jgi:hypothetical protein
MCDVEKKKARSPFLTKIAIVARHEFEQILIKTVRISLKPSNPIDVHIDMFQF